jgi:hypothetical protein
MDNRSKVAGFYYFFKVTCLPLVKMHLTWRKKENGFQTEEGNLRVEQGEGKGRRGEEIILHAAEKEE